PIIDRTAAPSSFGASMGGPMDHDLWCGSSMSPLGPPRSKRLHVGRMGVSKKYLIYYS
ncbi:hypothetical protein QBC45DRAFT_340306, partial [Copromyces sp. CBS 386.78]